MNHSPISRRQPGRRTPATIQSEGYNTQHVISSLSSRQNSTTGSVSRRDQRLCAIYLASAVIFVLTTLTATVLTKHFLARGRRAVYCTSPMCLKYNARFRESINTSVKPCDNFYRYVCDGWEKNHKFSVRQDIYQRYRQSVIEKVRLINVALMYQTPIQKAAKFFQSCEGARGTESNSALLINILKSVGLRWPHLAREADVMDTLFKLQKQWQWEAVLAIRVHTKSLTQPAVVLTCSEHYRQVLSRRNAMVKDATYGMYYSLLRNTFALPGEDSLDFEAFRVIERVVVPHLQAAQHQQRVVLWGGTPDPRILMSEDKMQAMKKALKKHYNIPLNQTVRFNVDDWDFVRAFFSILEQLGNDHVHFYIGWVAVQTLSLLTEPNAIDLYYGGKSSAESQHPNFCFEFVRKSLGFALDSKHVAPIATPSTLEDAASIIQNIQHYFVEMLEDNPWFKYNFTGLYKLRLADRVLRYYKRFLNYTLDEAYANFSDMVNSVTANLHIANEGRKLSDSESIRPYPFVVRGHVQHNAINRKDNTFVLMPYTLSEPLYDLQLPTSIRYGGLGAQVAMALSQTLFATHVKWDNRTREIVLELVQCFLPEATSLSTISQEEAWDVYSVSSMKALWNAYRSAESSDMKLLHSAPSFTQDMLFFTSWCYAQCDSPYRLEQRCNRPLRQFRPFASTFHCPQGSDMGTMRPCSVFS